MESHGQIYQGEEEKLQPAMTAQQKQYANGALREYRSFAVGNGGWLSLLRYEFLMLFCSGLPGLPGFVSRMLFYPWMFQRCGKRPAIGRGVVLRNPGAMSVGNKVLIDDYAVLDVRGEGASVTLHDFVSVGRGSSIVAKSGSVSLEQGVNIGSQCRIATQSKIHIGESTLIAAYAYIGPGNHQHTEDGSLIDGEMEIKGGVHIGKHVWIATRATILDGVTIGDGAIIGAHALVKDDVPAGAIVAGTPAKVIGMRAELDK